MVDRTGAVERVRLTARGAARPGDVEVEASAKTVRWEVLRLDP